jgi:hypothetical protein
MELDSNEHRKRGILTSESESDHYQVDLQTMNINQGSICNLPTT